MGKVTGKKPPAKAKKRTKRGPPPPVRPGAPTRECKRCGPVEADDTRQHCPHCGGWLRSNTGRLIHGLRSRRAHQALLPGQELQLALIAERRAELLRDMGGEDALPLTKRDVVTRFIELQTVADTLAGNLAASGVLSTKGRQRAALTAYLSVVDRLTKLAALLGLERKVKAVPSLDDFLKTRQQQQEVP